MTEAIVPLDVEAATVAYLRARNINARTKVPTTRVPGMVRVTRAGGVPGRDQLLDNPIVLVEVWGATASESWDTAVTIFGLFSVLGGLQRPPTGTAEADFIAALLIRSVEPEPPVTFDDPLAEELHRHQFTVSLVCSMGRMEVPAT